MPYWAPYHMSKWALEAFSDCLRRELLPFGIRVVVVQPGAFKSEAFEKQRDDFSRYKLESQSEFDSGAISMLQAAFERNPEKEKDPKLVVDHIIHAIHSRNSRLYYQPGRRFIPDLLMAKLPRRLVDRLLMKVGANAS